MYLTQQVGKQRQLIHVSPPLQECLSEGHIAMQHMDFPLLFFAARSAHSFRGGIDLFSPDQPC